MAHEVCLDEKIVSSKLYQDQKEASDAAGQVENSFRKDPATQDTLNTCSNPLRDPSFVSLFTLFRRLIHL